MIFSSNSASRRIGTIFRKRNGWFLRSVVLFSSSKSYDSSISLPKLAWKVYSDALHSNPLLTKVTIAATIFFCSDTATQLLDNADDCFDWNAPRAMSGAGFGVVAATWLHFWWGFLERTVASRLPLPTNRLSNTLVKVVLDQSIGAPLYIYTYYVLTNIWKTDCGMKETANQAAAMLWPTLLQHWKLWPAVHSINFYFFPFHHRVLVQNTVLVGWSAYLSHLSHGRATGMTHEENSFLTNFRQVQPSMARRETVRMTTTNSSKLKSCSLASSS